jgi:Ca2+-binding RTX toxin-like protein
MHGGPGDDYMEGNHGSDWMFGDGGEDDMLGGSSAGDGVIGGPVSPAGLRDGNDVMNGNGEDDVMLADNGQIIRPTAANGVAMRLTGGGFDLAMRNTRMAQTPEAAGSYGNDWMSGGDGVDDMYGQLGNDYMEGNEGEDAMVGDLGNITNNLIGLNDGLPDPGREQRIAPNAPFFDPGELIYQKGSLYRQVELYSYLSGAGGAGNDTMYGGGGNDALHGGAGNDILNGNAGDDHLFGGDDSDAVWGGPGHDTMFGGYGIDYLDVLPRPARADKKDSFPADPPTWFEAAKIDNYQGLDIMYGGWDRDWMQADVSAPGRANGDRMIDWVGAFNAFYRCDAAYGDWVITRQHSPSLVAFLQALAQGYGAVNTNKSGTSGFRETAIVFPKEAKFNANPPNPDNPAHFTCGPSQ